MCIISRKNLTLEERLWVAEWLLTQRTEKGNVRRGAMKQAAAALQCNRSTIQRIWAVAKHQFDNGQPINVTSHRSNCGRKKISIDLSKIKDIPYHKRGSIRALALALNIAPSTVWKIIKAKIIVPHSSALKPLLTEENKKARMKFALQAIKENTFDESPEFQDMYNTIHIDGKWFYMSKGNHRYYLLPTEQRPHRTCKNKRFIAKVMFIAAVARPRFNEAGECIFDGLLGIFPFVRWVPTKRRSKNRPAGTPKLKPVQSVNKDAYRNMLISKLLSAIMEKWPADDQGPIYIQQDNAKPHISIDDPEFCAATQATNRDIRLVFQLPNSPDFNVLDLGFFRVIQSLKDQTSPKTYGALVRIVKEAFNAFSPEKGNRVFLSLQLAMTETMKVMGNNNYQLKHIGKEALDRMGILPKVISPPPEVVQDCLEAVQAAEG